MTITVLLADDHALFRQGLASLVREQGEGWRIVGEAGHGEEAVLLAQAIRPPAAGSCSSSASTTCPVW